MNFSLVVSDDAKSIAGLVIVSESNKMHELEGKPAIPTLKGDAYYVLDVLAFMQRNEIEAMNVLYIELKE